MDLLCLYFHWTFLVGMVSSDHKGNRKTIQEMYPLLHKYMYTRYTYTLYLIRHEQYPLYDGKYEEWNAIHRHMQLQTLENVILHYIYVYVYVWSQSLLFGDTKSNLMKFPANLRSRYI